MYRIYLDIGEKETGAGLLDECFHCMKRRAVPTDPARGPEGILEDAAALCRTVIRDADLTPGDIACVGLLMRGAAQGETGPAEGLPFRDYPVSRILSEKLGSIPVYTEKTGE